MVCGYGSLSREASSKSVSRFLGSKPRSVCFTELRQMGLSRGVCVCEGLQVGSGVEVLPTDSPACSL